MAIIGRPFQGTHTRGNWQSDNAYDLSAPAGSPVYAPFAGLISPQFGYDPIGGWRLTIIGTGTSMYMAHFSRYAPGMLPGRRVKIGQIVGFVGDSGNARGTTPHLHFAVPLNDNPGKYIESVLFPRGSAGQGAAATPGLEEVARATPGQVFGGGFGGVANISGAIDAGISVGQFLARLNDRNTWIRIGEIVGGSAMMVIALRLLAQRTRLPIGR